MSKFTKGDWTADGREVDSEQSQRGYTVAIALSGDGSEDQDSNQIDHKEAEANAFLIAAAPDMFQVLKDLVMTYTAVKPDPDDWPDLHLTVQDAKKVIKKAEGK